MSKILKKIKSTKRDYTDYLFHFTRQRKVYDDSQDFLDRKVIAEFTAFDVLKQILNSGKLNGRIGYAPEKCVCFSETPIDELVWLMSQEEWEHDSRYTFYGVAVKKTWLYGQGGRPVIYQQSAEKDLLHADHKFRHNRYEPANDIDFSWEREWRIKTDALDLDSNETIVICATAGEAKEIMTNQFANISWLATSIELLRR